MADELDQFEQPVEDKEPEVAAVEQVEGETTEIPVQAGDQVEITLTAEESALINEVKSIKNGEFKVAEADDVVDTIDKTLALEVPAVDGAVVTVTVPADADSEVLPNLVANVPEQVVADIVTLVDAQE